MKIPTKDKKMLLILREKNNPDRWDVLVIRSRDGKHGHFAIRKSDQSLHFVKSRGFITRIRKKVNGNQTTEFEVGGNTTRTFQLTF